MTKGRSMEKIEEKKKYSKTPRINYSPRRYFLKVVSEITFKQELSQSRESRMNFNHQLPMFIK